MPRHDARRQDYRQRRQRGGRQREVDHAVERWEGGGGTAGGTCPADGGQRWVARKRRAERGVGRREDEQQAARGAHQHHVTSREGGLVVVVVRRRRRRPQGGLAITGRPSSCSLCSLLLAQLLALSKRSHRALAEGLPSARSVGRRESRVQFGERALLAVVVGGVGGVGSGLAAPFLLLFLVAAAVVTVVTAAAAAGIVGLLGRRRAGRPRAIAAAATLPLVAGRARLGRRPQRRLLLLLLHRAGFDTQHCRRRDCGTWPLAHPGGAAGGLAVVRRRCRRCRRSRHHHQSHQSARPQQPRAHPRILLGSKVPRHPPRPPTRPDATSAAAP